MAFPDQSTGYVAYAYLTGTNQQAQIYRTADDGQHWRVTAGTVKAVAGPNGSIFDGNLTVAFVDADHGWLTDTHTLWTTADGGDTWTRTALPVPGSVHGQLDFITTPVVGPTAARSSSPSTMRRRAWTGRRASECSIAPSITARTGQLRRSWPTRGRLRSPWPIPRPGSCSIRLNRHRCRPPRTPGYLANDRRPGTLAVQQRPDRLRRFAPWLDGGQRAGTTLPPTFGDAGVRDLRLCLRAAAASCGD